MKRFVEFDVLRGVLLLMMSVDHSPSSLRRFTDQPLGFFTTAECFVFVSAFLAGMLFRKRAEKLGFAAARSSSIHRAGRISPLLPSHLLPVFCSQICLSVLLIGRTESGLTVEPITSALVICQLLTAPLFAWFLELRSVAKQSARPIPPARGAKYHISLAENRHNRLPFPFS